MEADSTGKYEYLALREVLGVFMVLIASLITLLLISLLPWFLGKITGIIDHVWELFSRTDFFFLLRIEKHENTFSCQLFPKQVFENCSKNRLFLENMFDCFRLFSLVFWEWF